MSKAQQDKTIAMCLNVWIVAIRLCMLRLFAIFFFVIFVSRSIWKYTVLCVLCAANSFLFFIHMFCFVCRYGNNMCMRFLLLPIHVLPIFFSIFLYSFQLFPFFFIFDFKRSADAWDLSIWMKEHLDFTIQIVLCFYSVQCFIPIDPKDGRHRISMPLLASPCSLFTHMLIIRSMIFRSELFYYWWCATVSSSSIADICYSALFCCLDDECFHEMLMNDCVQPKKNQLKQLDLNQIRMVGMTKFVHYLIFFLKKNICNCLPFTAHRRMHLFLLTVFGFSFVARVLVFCTSNNLWISWLCFFVYVSLFWISFWFLHCFSYLFFQWH